MLGSFRAKLDRKSWAGSVGSIGQHLTSRFPFWYPNPLRTCSPSNAQNLAKLLKKRHTAQM